MTGDPFLYRFTRSRDCLQWAVGQQQLFLCWRLQQNVFCVELWAYYNCDTSTIRVRFERDTTSYEELCAFEQ